MLAAHTPETVAELTLAAEIIGFGFHALEALGQAADPKLPLNKILRLRGSAVSLSREAHKAQRKLDQLQRTRATQQPAASHSVPQPEPTRDQLKPVSPTEAERLATRTEAKIWLQAYHERETAERTVKNLKQNQAVRAAHISGVPAGTRMTCVSA